MNITDEHDRPVSLQCIAAQMTAECPGNWAMTGKRRYSVIRKPATHRTNSRSGRAALMPAGKRPGTSFRWRCFHMTGQGESP